MITQQIYLTEMDEFATLGKTAVFRGRNREKKKKKKKKKERMRTNSVSLRVALSREKEEEEDNARASVFKKRGEEKRKMRFLSL